MVPFTPEERAAIEAAITRAEAQTSGEIVVVVAPASDGYWSFALMWSALLALVVPLPLILATKWPVEYIYPARSSARGRIRGRSSNSSLRRSTPPEAAPAC